MEGVQRAGYGRSTEGGLWKEYRGRVMEGIQRAGYGRSTEGGLWKEYRGRALEGVQGRVMGDLLWTVNGRFTGMVY